MIIINQLHRAPSSPLALFTAQKIDIESLAKRQDLYTNDNFYFGFSSSNQSFLQIMNNSGFLAIKYGPTLSLYQKTAKGSSGYIYYINTSTQTLDPILDFKASISEEVTLNLLVPWAFKDHYLDMTEPHLEDASEIPQTSPELAIQSLIEQISNNHWPDELISQAAGAALSLKRKGVKITLGDLQGLKNKIVKQLLPPTHENFVNSGLINPALSIFDVMTEYPEHITVREVTGDDARIEIIVPSQPDEYIAIYLQSEPQRYAAFQATLNNTAVLSSLITELFPEMVNDYKQAHIHSAPIPR